MDEERMLRDRDGRVQSESDWMIDTMWGDDHGSFRTDLTEVYPDGNGGWTETRSESVCAICHKEDDGVFLAEEPSGRMVHLVCQEHEPIWRELAELRGLIERRDDITISAAATLGSIKTPRKAAASRENGKLGGRPRNTK